MTDYMFRALPAFVEYPDPPNSSNLELDIWCAAEASALPKPDKDKCIALDFGKTLSKVIGGPESPRVDDPKSDGGYTQIYPGISKRSDGSPARGAVYINETYMSSTSNWTIPNIKIPMYRCLIRYQVGSITRFHGFLARIISIVTMKPNFLIDIYWANQFEYDKDLPDPLPSGKWSKIPVNLGDTSLYEPSNSTLNASSNPGDIGFLFLSATNFKAAKLELPKLPPSLGSGPKWP